jgi:hypothetical protein
MELVQLVHSRNLELSNSVSRVISNTGIRNRDSPVGIATGYGLDDRGGRSVSPGRVKNFLSLRRPQRFLGPAKLLPNMYRGFFPRG